MLILDNCEYVIDACAVLVENLLDTCAGLPVYLLPGSDVDIVVPTNAAPIGVAETVALSFIELVTAGSVQRDWLAVLRPIFEQLYIAGAQYSTDYSKPPTPPSPPSH